MNFTPLDWYINTDHRPSEASGKIPLIFNSESSETLQQQIESSGILRRWHQSGFSLTADNVLVPLGKFPIVASAMARHREESIYYYQPNYLVVIQPSGEFAVSEISL